MAATSLSLPIDIPWERVCVTNDMLDPARGNPAETPPMWQSSLALFRYVPPDEYQIYPDRRIIYYKLSCTISNYQPRSEQLVGLINPGAELTLGAMANDEVLRRLATSLPCTGAVVYITVSPAKPTKDINTYPYFLEIQPRQRALYEQVTQGQESSSRSLENLQIRKDAASSNSIEVVDQTKGGGITVFGTGAQSSVDQGVKSLGRLDSQQITTTDSSREARETQSFTTQLSQMYTLLQAYHLGTNRVFFFLTPRPHAVEPPTGIIGPRKLDGIQDFFLVVSQPKEQDLPCLTARLDTGHLHIEPIMDYARDIPPQQLSVPLVALGPIKDDPAATETADGESAFYACYFKSVAGQNSLNAPAGYVVESVTDVVNVATGHSGLNNSSQIVPASPNGSKQITLTATATGYACHRNAAGDAANAVTVGPLRHVGVEPWPDTWTYEPGTVIRTVSVSFRSEVPSKQIGEQYVLTLTTRQLHCCAEPEVIPSKLVASVVLPKEVASAYPPQPPVESAANQLASRTAEVVMTVAEVNNLQRKLGDETMRMSQLISDPAALPSRDSDLLMDLMIDASLSDPRRRSAISRSAETLGLSEKELAVIAAGLGRSGQLLNRGDILTAPTALLEQATARKGEDLFQLRLAAANVLMNRQANPSPIHVRSSGRSKRSQGSSAVSKPENVMVPDMVGRDEPSAREMIKNARLKMGTITWEESDVERAHVISQAPEAGRMVTEDAEIDVVLSTGPIVRIPQLSGMHVSQALASLKENGIESEPEIVYGESDQPRNHVIRVTPSAGTKVTPQTELILHVSRGEQGQSEEIYELEE